MRSQVAKDLQSLVKENEVIFVMLADPPAALQVAQQAAPHLEPGSSPASHLGLLVPFFSSLFLFLLLLLLLCFPLFLNWTRIEACICIPLSSYGGPFCSFSTFCTHCEQRSLVLVWMRRKGSGASWGAGSCYVDVSTVDAETVRQVEKVGPWALLVPAAPS